MYSKGKYLMFQLLVMLFSPITSFLLALRFYKSEISQLFMIVFAFYFGYHTGFVYDLMHHYNDMENLYIGRSIMEIIRDERIFLIGNDVYHILFKIVVSRISYTSQFFGGAACAVYAAFFMFFFRQLNVFYKNKLSTLSALLLLSVVFVIEYYWYQGLRFRTGVFFFAGFFMKYINTNQKRYLFISMLAPLFHFSLYVLAGTVFLNFILKYTGALSRIVLFVLSVIIHFENIDFVPLMIKYLPITKSFGISIADERIRGDVRNKMAIMRDTGNFFYRHRNDMLLFFGLIILFLLWKYKAVKGGRYNVLFTYSFTLLTVAHFGYGDLIFYDRFYQAALLIFYTYLFVMSYINYDKIKHKAYLISIFVLPALLYAIATPLVEQRAYLFHLDLIFGNFFSIWDGNSQVGIDYGWKR